MSLTCDFGWGRQAEPSGPPECFFLLGLLDSLRAERDLIYKNYANEAARKQTYAVHMSSVLVHAPLS